MKLSMACLAAALSLTAAACADEVGTKGDTEISVKDTNYKATQDPKTRAIPVGDSLLQQQAARAAVPLQLINFATVPGITAEELDVTTQVDPYDPCTKMGRVTGNELQGNVDPKLSHVVSMDNTFTLIVQHSNDGYIDTASIMLVDGTELCQVMQTRTSIISENCTTAKKPPPPPSPPTVGGGVGGC